MNFFAVFILASIRETSATVSEREIMLTSGLKLGLSKKEMIEIFTANDTTSNIQLNQSILGFINIENQSVNDLKQENKITEEKMNEMVAALDELQDQVDKGQQIIEEFNISSAKKEALCDELNLTANTIKKYTEEMKPEKFIDSFRNQAILEDFKKQLENMKSEYIDLELEMRISLERTESLKSIYEIRCVGFDPDVSLKITGLERRIHEQSHRAAEVSNEILNIKSIIQSLRIGNEDLALENEKLKEETTGHENFLYFYNKGEFGDQIAKCVERKNMILEFLKNNEDEIAKMLPTKMSPLKELEKTRSSLFSLVNLKKSNFEKLKQLSSFNDEKISSELKIQNQIKNSLQSFEENKKQYNFQLSEFYSAYNKELSEIQAAIHEHNKRILRSVAMKAKLVNNKLNLESNLKSYSATTFFLASAIFGVCLLIMRFF